MNQETCFFQGADLFAREYNMPVLYGFISRPKRGHFEIEFISVAENPNEMPENYMTEIHARLLEKNILSDPKIWLWSHRRWKHKLADQLLKNSQELEQRR